MLGIQMFQGEFRGLAFGLDVKPSSRKGEDVRLRA